MSATLNLEAGEVMVAVEQAALVVLGESLLK